MKKKKILLVGILMLMLAILSGCGAESEDKKKDDVNINGKDNVNNINGNDDNVTEIKSMVGNYVEYNGNLYFWKLTADSREEAALFAHYNPINGHKNDLVRLGQDGNESTIVNAAGQGNLYIANDTIYYQATDEGEKAVYSVDLDGNNNKKYVNGELKYADGDYIYIQSATDIVVLNIKTGSTDLTINKADLVGIADGHAYYISGDSFKTINIGFIYNGEDNSNVASFSTSEYKGDSIGSSPNISLYGFSYENNKVQIRVGDIQGTGHFVQEGWIIEMDADGQNVSKKEDSNQDEESTTLLGVTELPVSYATEKGLVYRDPENGSEKVIIDNNKIKSEFGFKTYNDDEEAYIEVYSADKVDDKLYIVIDNGTHYPAGDIGWRYSYKRAKTAVFKYDLESGKIDRIYEF